LKNKFILVCCINSQSYGGLTYWINFVKYFKVLVNNSKINYKFIVNEGSEISKILLKRDIIVVKKYIYKNAFLRFIYEQLYIPLYLFKKLDADFFFNAKNIAPLLILNKSIIAIRNIEPFFYYKIDFSLKKIKSFLRYLLSIISIKKCHTIISVSKNTTKIIRRFSKKEIHLIPNGASVNDKYLRKWKISKTLNYLLNSSKFIPYANQLKLIQIYKKAQIKNIRMPPLFLAGGVEDKTYFKKIQKFIKENQLEKKIKFLGYVSRNTLHSLMAKCRLFIFSSELESCPQTIMEAKLVGCPILSTNIQPMPEFLKKEAFYFDINNTVAAAKKLNNIINLMKYKYKVKKRNKSIYLWKNSVKKYLDIFKKL